MIAVIDSCGSNITSVLFALHRIGVESKLTSDPKTISKAEKVILPGVGASDHAMERLKEDNLVECILNLKQPVLGICVGMQLMFSHSEEGELPLLDIFSGTIKHFTPEPEKSIPHMGWNNISFQANHLLFEGLPKKSFFYFVHSYYPPLGEHTIAECFYGDRFSAVVAKNNFMGTQFHPERSGTVGALLLENFIRLP